MGLITREEAKQKASNMLTGLLYIELYGYPNLSFSDNMKIISEDADRAIKRIEALAKKHASFI
jgi:hypothetical protein